MQRLSLYAENLPPDAKDRYLAKISVINGTDPLSDGLFEEEVDVTPPVDACDLVSYLVLQTSFVTAKQFKARKGLEAYNQFVCGWVKEIKTRKVADKYLTTGRVSSYFVQLLALFASNIYMHFLYYYYTALC